MARQQRLVLGSALGLTLCSLGCPSDDSASDQGSSSTDPTSASTSGPPMTTTTMPGDASTSTTEPPTTDGSGSSSTGAAVPCTLGVFEGDHVISNEDEALELENYTSITGDLTITGSDLETLEMLACLEEVGGDLAITGNPNLGVFGAFTELTELNELTISGNPFISTLDTFVKLERVETSLIITDNAILADLVGLGSLEVVVDQLTITDNPMLCVSLVVELGMSLTMPPMGGSSSGNDNTC